MTPSMDGSLRMTSRSGYELDAVAARPLGTSLAVVVPQRDELQLGMLCASRRVVRPVQVPEADARDLHRALLSATSTHVSRVRGGLGGSDDLLHAPSVVEARPDLPAVRESRR